MIKPGYFNKSATMIKIDLSQSQTFLYSLIKPQKECNTMEKGILQTFLTCFLDNIVNLLTHLLEVSAF